MISALALLGLLGVAIGILAGLLMSNAGRDPERRESPWPYVVGIVALAVCGTVAAIFG